MAAKHPLRDFAIFAMGGPILSIASAFGMMSAASEAVVPLYLLGVIAGVAITLGSVVYGGVLGMRWLISKEC